MSLEGGRGGEGRGGDGTGRDGSGGEGRGVEGRGGAGWGGRNDCYTYSNIGTFNCNPMAPQYLNNIHVTYDVIT